MCRFVAYQGTPRPADSVVFHGEHSLYVQSYRPRELLSGSVNADGYGVVWYRAGQPARLGSPFPIWHDPHLPGALAAIEAGTLLAALRNITPGIPVAETGIPPVLLGRWSFILNGFIQDFRTRFMQRLHASIPPALYGDLTGVSDTEALALLCVAECERGASPGEAVERVVGAVVRMVVTEGASAQLNMLLTDGDRLAVCRASSGPSPNSLYLRKENAPSGSAVTVASEALDPGEDWTSVPSGTLVEVEGGRAVLRPLVVPTDPAPPDA